MVVARDRSSDRTTTCFRFSTSPRCRVQTTPIPVIAPFGIQHFYTDGWGAYERHLNPQQHTIGKANTQTIERKHLTMRTRIKRLTRAHNLFLKVH
jgi:IS1 family transposase